MHLIIIHGPLGSGKTATAKKIAKTAKERGIKVRGILAERLITGNETIGYNGLNLETGRREPLVKATYLADSQDWEYHGRPRYRFSKNGFKTANRNLVEAARDLDPRTIVFVDEFGHLEKNEKGLFPGVSALAEAISDGGVAVVLCRSERGYFIIN